MLDLPRARPEAVGALIAGAVGPPEAEDEPPHWLLPAQQGSFRRALAAVRRHGGCLLADPVGSGKTFVAMAVARALGRPEPVRVAAPAVLVFQWERAIDRVSLAATVTSHERISRGEPLGGTGPVILDECHRFRTAGTKRYRTIAPDLVGRPVILVSATPIVNRLADLVHQLLLAVPDDALRWHGLGSLRSLAEPRAAPPLALARLVVRSRPDPGAVPGRADRTIQWSGADDPFFARALVQLDRLRLSPDKAVAGLIRIGLYRALGSSPAALLGSIQRYRTLVEHAAMARRAGRRITRREACRAAGALPEQLVMWELLDGGEEPCDLALGDRDRLRSLGSLLRGWIEAGDRKLGLLRALVADRAPTICFAGAIETVGHLRRGLGVPGIAWITGASAGIGSLRAGRRAVLEAFSPNGVEQPARPEAPWLLLASDVAAEGLDLQRAARIVHYDLPWTAVRLDQRDGRAIRRGADHARIEVVRLDPPPELEARLALGERLATKARLPAGVGLARGLDRSWHSADRLRAAFENVAPEAGWASIASTEPGALALATMTAGPRRHDLVLVATTAEGDWSEDPALIEARLLAARRPSGAPPELPAIDLVVQSLAAHLLIRISALDREALLGGDGGAGPAIKLVREMAVRARRDRQRELVALCDTALRFLARGKSAGEETLARAVSRGDRRALERAAELGGFETPPAGVRIHALLVFRPG